jgi:hypothetical protein
MAVVLMLLLFAVLIGIDYFDSVYHPALKVPPGTTYAAPGFEMLGTLAQDGGEVIDDTFLGEGI